MLTALLSQSSPVCCCGTQSLTPGDLLGICLDLLSAATQPGTVISWSRSHLLPALQSSRGIPAGSQPVGIFQESAPCFSGDPHAAPAPGRSTGICLEWDPLGAGAQSEGAAVPSWPGLGRVQWDPCWIPGDVREGSAWCCHPGATLWEVVRFPGSAEIPPGFPCGPADLPQRDPIHWLAQPHRGILAVLASAEQQGDPGDLPQRDPLSACQGHAAALPGGAAEFGGIPMGSAAQGIPADPPSSLPQAPLPFSGRRLPAGDEGWLSHPGEPLSHPGEPLSPPGELLASRAAMLRVLDVGLERCLALHSAYIPVPRHR